MYYCKICYGNNLGKVNGVKLLLIKNMKVIVKHVLKKIR